MRPRRGGPVAFVLKGYPRLSETFIAQEIRGLEQEGLDIVIVSLRRPTDRKTHPVHAEIRAPVAYLPEYLHNDPLRVFRAWLSLRKTPLYPKARAAFLSDLLRDRTRNRVRRFGQALVLACEFGGQVSRLHAHFLHTPASVARYASMLTGLPFSASAHAKDIWTSPDWDLAEKLDEGLWTVTCTRVAALHLASLAREPGKVYLVYHGLDLDRFPPPGGAGSLRDGRDPVEPVRLLSVGRAVPKKGFDLLVEALATLPRDISWRFDHVGGGELRDELEARAAALGIGDRIGWHGSMQQQKVLAFYRSADIFVLPCRVAADGDRDGLPNVLVEAASQCLPLVSTPVSGVPELIEDGANGLLVPPEDAGSLARALERLIRDPELRHRLGAAAEAKVRSQFDHRAGIAQLMYLFEDGRT